MKIFDIKERTSNFAIRIVKLTKKFPKDVAARELAKQLIRSGTSIGANTEEADGSPTRKDFFYKISIAKKEAKETKYWLNTVIKSELLNNPSNKKESEELFNEAHELSKILSSIYKKKSQ